MWGLFLDFPRQRNRKEVSFANQRNFFFKKFLEFKNSGVGFVDQKKRFRDPKTMVSPNSFFVIFNDFDGFAKHHPSTMKFRFNSVVSRKLLRIRSTQLTSHPDHPDSAALPLPSPADYPSVGFENDELAVMLIRDEHVAEDTQVRHCPPRARAHQPGRPVRDQQVLGWRRCLRPHVCDLRACADQE
jgi:hypothetical protein